MDSYSRLIAWLKILLPLAALMLLSTLFLLSRNIDTVSAIPFAEAEIKSRLRDEQITAPFFSGTTSAGDQLTVSASVVRLGQRQENQTDDLSVIINLASGESVVLSSEQGSFDASASQLTLSGKVVISMTTGYDVTAQSIVSNFEELSLTSKGAISAQTPIGTLQAGKMRLNRPTGGQNIHLNFTNGVKLLYLPGNIKE